jgi:hypothetical protein
LCGSFGGSSKTELVASSDTSRLHPLELPLKLF